MRGGRKLSPEQQADYDEFVELEDHILELLAAAGYTQNAALKLLGLAKTTLYYRRHPRPKKPPQHPKAAPPKTISAPERQRIAELLRDGREQGLSVYKIFFNHVDSKEPLLGSLRTFYRVNNEIKTVPAPLRHGAPRAPQPPRIVTATRPGEVLCWDITWLPGSFMTRGFHLYTVLDLHSRKIVGHTVQLRQDKHIATDLIAQVIAAEQLNHTKVRVLHTDNGAVMTSTQMRHMLDTNGVELSLIRPGVSNDNPFEESSHRTLKHHRYALTSYPNIQAAAKTMAHIIDTYNNHDPHSGLAGFTPQQVYTGEWKPLLKHRKAKEEIYYNTYPQRRPPRSMFQPPPATVGIKIGTPPPTPQNQVQ